MDIRTTTGRCSLLRSLGCGSPGQTSKSATPSVLASAGRRTAWSSCRVFCAAVVVIRREYLYPYSGAEDAARYLKSVGADHGPMFGFLYGIVAVQAYFDHNIFANIPTAYYHQGLPFDGNTFKVDELQRVNPEYLVAYAQRPEVMLQESIPQFTAQGYEIVHFSDGYYLYKRSVYEREVYFILRRTRPSAGQAPSQFDPGK